MNNDESNKRDSNEKPILSDHKKVGKKFIPPFLQLGIFEEVSYINNILPEMLWICLACDYLGFHRGVEVSEMLASVTSKVHKSETFINFALASSYNTLESHEVSEIKHKIEGTKELDDLCFSIEPLTSLYEGHPLSIFCLPRKKVNKSSLIKRLKRVVDICMDKQETLALAGQATVLSIRSKNGGVSFTREIKVPDINAILLDPGSEAANRAGAFVKTSVLMELASTGSIDPRWAESFWNQGMRIDACEL